jgi:AcrR family transcriptional regulator
MNKHVRPAPASKIVVDAALALVDRRGLAALTIRRLAAEVGAPPMSLYAHFRSKEQLQDLMFERLVQRLFPAHDGTTWQQEFETAGRHARTLLLGHPYWVPLLARPALPTSSLGFYDHILRLMVEDGFARDAAVHAFSSAMSFALGFVLTERMMTPRSGVVIPIGRMVLLKKAIPQFPAGAYGHVAASKSAFDAWSFDKVFDLGLRSLIAGIESEFVRSPPKAKRTRRSAGG